MMLKSIIKASFVLCITAILAIALCGCEDLGAYEDTEEYYASFGDIVLIDGTSRERSNYSVEDYFYNEESREKFLAGEDGAYKGVEHSDYVYIAIPFESNIDMDTLALFIQSQEDVTVYINVFVTDVIPSEWRAISDNVPNTDGSGNNADSGSGQESSGTSTGSSGNGAGNVKVYDDPAPEARVGEAAVHLKKGKWDSFVLDVFQVDGQAQKSIKINDGQYVLLQIRNNSGVRVFDEEKQAYVDAQTGIELQQARITMTNLLIRALDVESGNEAQGG